MVKRLILAGPGACGKDFFKQWLETQGFTCSVSCTTRPMRPGEVEGINYYYITEGEFIDGISKDRFREWNKFADRWYYGTTRDHFGTANLFVMTPSGVASLTPDERSESFVLLISVEEEVRRERLLARADADNAERRLLTDREDFGGFTDFDMVETDPLFDPQHLLGRILSDCPDLKTALLKDEEHAVDKESV